METYTVEVYENGTREWYQNDQLHRLDGPAFEGLNGERSWWQNGLLHRTDGPAIELADGTTEWWIDGVQLTEKEFCAKMKHRDACDGKKVIIDGVAYRLVKV